MSTEPKKDIDEVTGVETTGHEWDGLKELNNPAPRWWLIVWMLCFVWAVGYWIVYPAWPTLDGHTKGVAGWTQYNKLKTEQAQIVERQSTWLGRFQNSDYSQIKNDQSLYEFAVAGGQVVYKENCAPCHGTGGEGRIGYPNLNDDDWLFGGTLEAIDNTLKVGARSGHQDTHATLMPAFGRDGLLTSAQIGDVTTYVLNLKSGSTDEAYIRGEAIFVQNCVSCHGIGGIGNQQMGAPKLNDAIWLYGSDKASIEKTLINGRAGVMPSWESRLSLDARRQAALYVHSLGGGE
jgi:cytochrome c oxidase cbb3-type subunit 3